MKNTILLGIYSMIFASSSHSQTPPAKQSLAEEIIFQQESFLSANLPRPTGDDLMNSPLKHELERRINIILNNWKLIEEGKKAALADANTRILLLAPPNKIESEYLKWLKNNRQISSAALEEVYTGTPEDGVYFCYGFNSQVASTALKNYASEADFVKDFNNSEGASIYSDFAIPWIFSNTKHFIK